jgi:hypothetical protein
MAIFSNSQGRALLDVDEQTRELDLSPLATGDRCSNLAEALATLRHLRKLTLRLRDETFPAALAALKSLSDLVELAILSPPEGLDLSPLAACQSLRSLRLLSAYKVDATPLGSLLQLEHLTLDGAVKNLKVVNRLARLKALAITANKAVSMEHLAGLASLTSLELVGSKLSHTAALRKLSTLERLDLRNTDLESLDVLPDGGALRVLEIDRCRKLAGIDAIDRAQSVQELSMNDLATVPTLAPLARLSRLTRLFMEKTTSADGSLSVLAQIGGLRSVVLSASSGDRIPEVARRMPWCTFSLRDAAPGRPWHYVGDVAIYGVIQQVQPFTKLERVQQDLRPLFALASNREIEELLRRDLESSLPSALPKLTFASTDAECIVRSEVPETMPLVAARIQAIRRVPAEVVGPLRVETVDPTTAAGDEVVEKRGAVEIIRSQGPKDEPVYRIDQNLVDLLGLETNGDVEDKIIRSLERAQSRSIDHLEFDSESSAFVVRSPSLDAVRLVAGEIEKLQKPKPKGRK